MSNYLKVTHSLGSGSTYEAEHTFHGLEIAAMRADDEAIRASVKPEDATFEQGLRSAAMRTAAALLEVHDDTGISLDNWVGPRELVELCLHTLGYPDGTFLENHV